MATKTLTNNDGTEKMHVLPLATVYADRNWNMRKGEVADTATDDGEGSKGFIGLVCDIARDGQKTAVVVRPNPERNTKGHPSHGKEFLLVSGFQRYAALASLAAGEQLKVLTSSYGGMTEAAARGQETDKPTIKAFIRNYTEAEARAENLRENLQRNDVNRADIAFGVIELHKADPNMSHDAIARLCSKSQGYVSQLIRIGNTVKAKLPKGALWEGDPEKGIQGSPATSILEAWRSAPVKAPNNKLEEIGKLPIGEQAAAYVAIAREKEKSGGTGTGKVRGAGETGWVSNASIDAARVASMLGYLVRDTESDIDDAVFTAENMPTLLNCLRQEGPYSKKIRTEEQWKAVATAASKAFYSAQSETKAKPVPAAASSDHEVEASGEEEEEEEAPAPVAKKGKKASAKNGAARV